MAVTERTFEFGSFQWKVRIQDQIDVEYVVEHLMRASAYHIKMGVADETAPVGRDIKDALIKNSVVI